MINDIYTGEFNGMIAGTGWGAFNALTERLDWYRSGYESRYAHTDRQADAECDWFCGAV